MPRRAVETVPRRKTKGGLCPEKPLTREGKAAHFPQQGFTDTHGRRSFHIRPDGQGSPYLPLSPGTGETGHRGTGGFRPYFPARGAVCSGPVYQNPSGYRPGWVVAPHLRAQEALAAQLETWGVRHLLFIPEKEVALGEEMGDPELAAERLNILHRISSSRTGGQTII